MSNSIHWMNHKPMYKVLDKLEGVKPAGQNKWQAKCPAHDDRSPSLSIAIGDDGRILLYCHAGCNNEEICTALSIEQKDLFVQKSKPYRVHSQIVATYDYVDENGNLLFQVVREKPKKFWQRRPDGNGSWIRNLQGVRRVLYRLPELLQADPNQPVFLVEGEKDADRLITEGLIATTTPMGAGKWREEYTEILRDRRVVVLPDNDAAGEKHAVRIANALIDVAAEVKIISLPDLPDKGDISDWLDAGGTAKQLLDNAARVEAYQPPTEAKSLDYSIANAEIPYRATENGLFRLKPTQDGDMPVQLTNFTARIVEDIIADDGVETSHEFMIVAKLTGTETRFKVPAAQFAGLNWVTEHLGPCAIVFPPFFTKDYARAAIQLLSKDINVRYIYRHIGWRKIGDHHFYLHAGGAIGAEGPVEKVEVSLEDALQHYILPAPPAGGDLVTAIQTSIAILDLAPDNIIIPLYSALWRSVLGHCPFAVHLSGHTGTGKSEIAALLQQHFGAGMMAKNLPASWSSTANALEGLSFTAKDTLIVVDDFAPGGSSSEVNRFHREADRILRAQGNRSGRQRMRSNATLRPTKPPRGLILSTGEDVPRGQSIRARMLILELGLNYLDWGLLTQCQGHAADGLFAQSMSAFIQWLAPQYESIKNRMPQEIAEFRLSATQSNQHKRTPEIIAELALG
ncbi:MAG: DUF927 domain-containing protein, partial [Planctomycetes bacterium]|nr:DUF927 domain-containing protein [Planctomycetota bacterium]